MGGAGTYTEVLDRGILAVSDRPRHSLATRDRGPGGGGTCPSATGTWLPGPRSVAGRDDRLTRGIGGPRLDARASRPASRFPASGPSRYGQAIHVPMAR